MVYWEIFFIVELFSFVVLGYGERVRLLEIDRWYVKVGVLFGLEILRVGYVDSYVVGIVRESFNESFGFIGFDVVIFDMKEMGSMVKDL